MESFGSNKEAVLKDLVQQVQRVLQLLDHVVAGEYHEAVKQVPALVQRESKVEDFLRTEDFHTLRAARRIAQYWKVRKEFFEDRWLLPMTQTGSGALFPDQVEILRTGFHVHRSCIRHSVAIVDGSRLPKKGPVDALHPILFYLFSVSACEKTQMEGVTVFHVVRNGYAPELLPPRENLQKLGTCLPFKFNPFIIARSFDPGRDHLLDYFAFHQQRQSERNFGRAEYVIGHSLRHTLNLLEERGLDRSNVPLALGGDYFYSEFDEWVRARLTVEGAMEAAPPVRNSSVANDVASKIGRDIRTAASVSVESEVMDPAGLHPLSADPAGVSTTSSEDNGAQRDGVLVRRLPDESQKDFEKRRHFIYGRRSYQKKRQHNRELQEQHFALETANTALRSDNRQLEALLVKARLVVAKHLDDSKSDSTTGTEDRLLKSSR